MTPVRRHDLRVCSGYFNSDVEALQIDNEQKKRPDMEPLPVQAWRRMMRETRRQPSVDGSDVYLFSWLTDRACVTKCGDVVLQAQEQTEPEALVTCLGCVAT